ncbi:tyrosine-type recombinase/integrase [Deinococcus yavapaiensis]|uniref:Integrase/recombinase XerD n=1 Tax=Deinococcus yavapaiensis KR-236 TaxID=694435 RepID=A0A318S8Z7_9DEIO|nr:phage integrase N-terminal SAM-like domain-containing protein [Deinococcus yavapaiensis]PYE52052.1 integrase/recombinase XerD [Deinococcus yavapaiensis KR-236]
MIVYIPSADANDRLPEHLRRALARGDIESALHLLDDHTPGKSGGATRRNYLSSWRRYLRWAQSEQRSVLNATPNDAVTYLNALLHAHAHAPATIHNHVARLRALYERLHALGAHLGPNPFDGLRLPTNRPEEHRDVYTDDELDQLLAHATVAGRALLLLGAHAGLTGPQVVRLRWPHVDLTRRLLHADDLTLPIDDDLARELQAYAVERNHGDLLPSDAPLFDIKSDHELRAAVYAACTRALVPYKAWRALRNHAGLRLLRASGDPALVAARLGVRTFKAVEPLVKLLARASDHTISVDDRSS